MTETYTQWADLDREGTACSNCGQTYELCTARLFRSHKPCCGECGYVDTHNERIIATGERVVDHTDMPVLPKFAVGQVLDLPPEPPVGSTGQGTDRDGDTFTLGRDLGGWGWAGSDHRFTWESVMDLWRPFTITRLP